MIEAAEIAGEPVVIAYTNQRGEHDPARVIIPTGRLLRGPTEWHPDAPWLIEAWDVDRKAVRTFDPAKMQWKGRASCADTRSFRST